MLCINNDKTANIDKYTGKYHNMFMVKQEKWIILNNIVKKQIHFINKY